MKPEIIIRHPITGPFDHSGIVFPEDEGRTKQSFQDECNINSILDRYQATGLIEHQAKHGAQYGEFDSIDFTEAQQIVATAQSMFEDLPYKIRARFQNPGEFLDFCGNPANKAEMVDLGLSIPADAAPEAASPPPETVGQPVSPAQGTLTLPKSKTPPPPSEGA
jgi:phage internal scaffolding protein